MMACQPGGCCWGSEARCRRARLWVFESVQVGWRHMHVRTQPRQHTSARSQHQHPPDGDMPAPGGGGMKMDDEPEAALLLLSVCFSVRRASSLAACSRSQRTWGVEGRGGAAQQGVCASVSAEGAT
jgi:hypothetical protein